MKTLLISVLLYLALIVSANAGYIGAYMGYEFVLPQGFSELRGCANNPSCITIPVGTIVGYSLTSTIKDPNIEVLAAITCNFSRGLPYIWVGHHKVGTLPVTASINPGLSSEGQQCWIEYAAINNGGPVFASYEIQAVLYYL